ncbi:hypothetical protein [Leptospira santarosai]|uniref:Uncharacterized protein n=1 Tax=Leptospira santarosai serovar Arenal str. MAVJ 401 TaxID=1049976 RepID=M6K0B3_9LEPT|nr:hypothetical protein [Leptospira santarosai]EKS06518.1 hypothetical protein LEP1GSC071_1163 [Leptospira santarosai str. JET]EMN21207.1 hypothetical protein LEP1GSC063_0833 [Leptospira santarosai serovar Arenal str. MAVJ 401]MDI7191280.1 hypothetical protein [Leptospira santarosai]MDI7204947.1 hypothetical protein [Leptospira santarosai]MDI7211970.1 hypothetical protein [Leptospira santarosai]
MFRRTTTEKNRDLSQKKFLKKNGFVLKFWKKFRIFCIVILIAYSENIFSEYPSKPIGEFKSEYDQFWFLYQKEIRAGESEMIFRPFYSSYKEEKSAYRFQTVLYPIYYSEETKYWKVWSFLFLFSGTSMLHEDVGEDSDVLTPLLFWGWGDTAREKYFGFFPFAGKLKNKIGYSELSFFLFPFYTNWKYKDYEATSVLWPLFLYASSETREEFRIFPLYSKKVHRGKYERFSVLWPIFQWGTTFQDKREPVHYKIFFPLFGFKDSESGNMKSRGFLIIPLLGSFFGYGYDKRTGEKDFNALFFLFQYGTNQDEDYGKLILFPFFGHYRFASKQTTFVTPFYFHLQTDTYHIQSDDTFLIPFYFNSKRKYVQWDRDESYLKLWPVFKYQKDREGNVIWNVLSLFPIKSEVVDRIWDPLWSILEYQKLSNGEKRVSVLMRMYTQRWTETEFHASVPFILELELTPEKTSWKFLYGLIGYERIETNRNLQLLWFIKI